MKKKNKIIFSTFFFLLFIILNPLFLEKFTIDGTINLYNLLILANILSYSNLIIFLLIILTSDFLIKVKKNIKNLLIFLLVLFLGLVICEILLKKYTNFSNSNKTIKIENYEFAATYSYNDFGFRDKSFGKNQKNKVFFLGDSFVFGSAVDDDYTFNKIVERKFELEQKEVRVFNFGIPGTGPNDYLKNLERFKYLKPQVTIVFLYVDNDIIETFNSYYLNSLKSQFFIFISKIEILNIASRYFFGKQYIKKIIEKHPVNNKYQNLFYQELINPYILLRGSLDSHHLYEKLENDFSNGNYTKNNLLKIKQLTKELNSKLILVVIPSKYQINKKYLSYLKKELNFNVSRYEVVNDNLQKKITKWARDNEIETIDILPNLKNNLHEYYYLIDDHFNKNGNILVSNILFERLKSEFK
jgi:hypothetical protein